MKHLRAPHLWPLFRARAHAASIWHRYGVAWLNHIFFCLAALILCLHSPAFAGQPHGMHPAPLPEPGWPTHLRMQGGPPGGSWTQLGKLIADELTREVLPTTSKFGSGVKNIADISGDAADIALSIGGIYTAKASGEMEYSSLKTENTALLARAYPQILYIVAQKDFVDQYGISDVESLIRIKAPVRFVSARPGSASAFMLNMLFRHGYGVDYHSLKYENGWAYTYANFSEMADAFVAGDIDCMAFSAGSDSVILRGMEDYAKSRIIPVSKSVLEKLEKKFKTGIYTILPGAYESAEEPVETICDTAVLFVHKDLPDSLAFAIAGALWNSRRSIGLQVPDFLNLSRDPRIEGIPVHPGALRFWDSLPKS